VRCNRSIKTTGNLFFNEILLNQIGTCVRYVNSGLEEGEVNKKCSGKCR
jgi:hypothetical protein